jgi:hypothetical protein
MDLQDQSRMVSNKQVKWSHWICCSVLFGCCYLSFFKAENDPEGESKESKVMVMVDIFWYLTLFCGIRIAVARKATHTQLYMDLAWFWSCDSKVEMLLNTMPVGCTGIEHCSGSGIDGLSLLVSKIVLQL